MSKTLGSLSVGTTVYIKESDEPVPYLIVKQSQASILYSGTISGTWLLRKNLLNGQQWNNTNANNFANSSIYTWLNNTFIQNFSENVQSYIGTIKIPYYTGGSSGTTYSGSNGLSCKAFLLSGSEVGITNESVPHEGNVLDYFETGDSASAKQKRIANNSLNQPSNWWLRTPSGVNNYMVYYINTTGGTDLQSAIGSFQPRPAIVMFKSTIVDDDNNIIAIPSISSINVPSLGMVNESLSVTWSKATSLAGPVTYQLQRNYNNTGWITIVPSLSTTSYTDTLQSGWTQVQYRVAPIVNEEIGVYTTSLLVSVVDPEVLVISGQDEDLGTITNNIPYTVSSNTGNPISLTRTVNGAQVVTLTVNSGFAYNIPIADLPTGTGTIQITASVENTSNEIQTQTRTWTYYKTPINISSTGGIAQLTQNGQNIWPVTVPDAVEAPVYLGGNLNAALNKLGQAALYTAPGKPLYNQVDINLANASVGDEINIPFNGKMVPHIVVQIGNPDPELYDSSCDGVWLLMKDCFNNQYWGGTTNAFATATLNTTYLPTVTTYYNEIIRNNMNNVIIPYCVGNNSSVVKSLEEGWNNKVFILSGYELGFVPSNNPYLPNDGKVLAYFQGTNIGSDNKRVAYFNGSLVEYWTRSPYTNSNNSVYGVTKYGNTTAPLVGPDSIYVRPCFILPSNFSATFYVDNNNNVLDNQQYSTGGTITDIFGYEVPISQFEIGTYVGTGTYGSSNPTSITTASMPKFVCITNTENPYIRAILPYGGYGFMFNVNTAMSTAISACGLNTTWSDIGVSWYNTANAQLQLNESGVTYRYVIFN